MYHAQIQDGEPNVNQETGIHFGVIHQGSVLQAWSDSAENVSVPQPDGDSEQGYLKYSKEGYLAFQTDDNPYIMVARSPYFTYARPCSPCYPNSGDLDSVENGTLKTYCFGHDWFEHDRAPYAVFSVRTGKPVYPDAALTNRVELAIAYGKAMEAANGTA